MEALTEEERDALRKLMGNAVCGSFNRMDYRIIRALLDERDALAAKLAAERAARARAEAERDDLEAKLREVAEDRYRTWRDLSEMRGERDDLRAQLSAKESR